MALKKRLQLLREKGFTLIELMIVVGIIGILVTIAAPNFARYQSKSRQTEAKIGLAAIYVGEKAFYSEYSAYISSLDAIGYAPEGNKRYYSLGFNTIDTVSVSGFPVTPFTGASFPRVNYPGLWTTCTPSLASGTTGAIADPQSFTAAASGQIRNGIGCDLWTIDEQKMLQNTAPSL